MFTEICLNVSLICHVCKDLFDCYFLIKKNDFSLFKTFHFTFLCFSRSVFEKSLGLRLQKMNPNTDYHCLKTFGSYFNEDIPIPAVRLNTGFGYRMFITFRYK
jgi:hypothetical protein